MNIQEEVPLKDKNWFKTGGSARYFCEPVNAQEFQEALAFAKENNLEMFVLGEGANVVISDEGFDGLVIHPQKSNPVLNTKTGLVTANAGTRMDDLIGLTVDNNLIGLEIFSHIPGTVGGSVYINLHYFEAFISDYLLGAEVIHFPTGTIKKVNKQWFEFGYDKSKLMEKEYYLISATFQLEVVDSIGGSFARGRRWEIIRHRNSRYPKENTCGSFFRNFHPNEVSLMYNNKKMIYVAYYLDKIGVKGTTQVGDIQVSPQHANMLVNKGSGTSADIVALARALQEKVKNAFGIIPQPECIFVGFKDYPLIR